MKSGNERLGEPVVPKGGRNPYRFFCGTVRRGRREVSAVVYANSWKALAETLRTTIFDVRQSWDEDYAAAADVAGGAVAAANPGRLVVEIHQRWIVDGEEAAELAIASQPMLRDRSAPASGIAKGAALHLGVWLNLEASAWVVNQALLHGTSPEAIVEQIVEAAARRGQV